jgi:hypothetical protein
MADALPAVPPLPSTTEDSFNDSGLEKSDRRITVISLILLVGIFGYFLLYIYHRFTVGHFGDFPTFYHAAKALVAGRDPFIPVEDGLAYVYPPLLAWLFIPLTGLSKINAARVVFPINMACAVMSIFIGARELSRRFGVQRLSMAGLLAIAALTTLMGENELRGQLQQMETDAIMLLMFTLALRWLDGQPLLAGGALSVAFNIKYLSLVFLPYLLLRRRWKAAAGMIGGSIFFMLLPAITIGWKEDFRCLGVAMGGLLRWVGIHPAVSQHAHIHPLDSLVSISLTSGMARLLKQYHLPDSWALLGAMIWIGLIIGAATMMYRHRRFAMLQWPDAERQKAQPYRGLVALEWLGLIAAALLFSPNTNTRHLVMAILLEVAAAVLLLIPRPGVSRVPLLVGTGMLLVGFIMPIPSLCGPQFKHEYFRFSGPSWGLLVMYLTLLWTGLRYISVPVVRVIRG